MSRSPFIVIESLDAAGGSTQTRLLLDRLYREGHSTQQYHFPQEHAPTGRLIYEKYLHDKGRHPLSRREQALLYIQDFYSKLDEMKRVLSDDVIISDRYCTSTMAYQTIGLHGKKRKDMLNWIRWLCWEGSPQLLRPDLVIMLDIPVHVALKALEHKKRDVHEQKDKLLTFRQSYMRLAKEEGWAVVDNMKGEKRKTRKEVHEEVWNHVQSVLM